MKIHEYQAKSILKRFGVPVPEGEVVHTPDEVRGIADKLGGRVVVKAQIHAGGRGKGSFKEADAGEKGGVRLTKSVEEAAEEAKKMLGRTLVTHQTGPAGKQVNRIYIEAGSAIVIEVADTGVGIPADDLPRIFERFYKADRARSSGGTGLGLAISRHLVEVHGGEIWVKSKAGKGSTFYFTFPKSASPV